ncbi:acrylate utilization transcriptional regulator AcuR [Pararhodospirillum oryzae]|nr:TetR/AcrR family transcriptional regulator [Pararhodospirillum oryzae]
MNQPDPKLRKRGRPPKDPDALGSTRDKLLRAGVSILTEKGFSAVGIEEILSTAGVPKGSFYHYFDNKESFGLALIDSYAEYFNRKLSYWFERVDQSPLQRFRGFIADAREGMSRHDFRRGCLVGNLGQEMGVLPESFRQRISGVFADWEARTADCLRAACAAGEIPQGADCNELAVFFWIGWEGAVLRAKLERNADALDAFSQGFFKLLGAFPQATERR